MSVREGSPCAIRARCEYDGTDFVGLPAPAERPVGPGRARGRAGPPQRRRAGGGRRGRAHGRRGPRTRAGDRIHATGGEVPAAVLQRAVNALLPRDVAIRDLRRAPDGFHPRYAARYREYRYTVWNGPRSPLRERQALGVRSPAEHRRHGERRVGLRGPARLLGLRRRRTGPRSGPCTWSGSGSEGRLVTIDVRAQLLPPGAGPAHGRRPPGGRPWTGSMQRASARHSPGGDRPSTGQRPRRRDSASVASSSDDGRRGDDKEDEE